MIAVKMVFVLFGRKEQILGKLPPTGPYHGYIVPGVWQNFCLICAAHDAGMRIPDARFIPYTAERSDGTDVLEKLHYIVESLAVIDYRIFQRSVPLKFRQFSVV